eukprot:gnl/Hemi2/5978_TR2075_c0_g5_i1.p1 gnl/Hemi2/5978_TR2075_c0_g5~~gnl/Hemi2/5978_TR2075_c0_g5_i1.p1  ORF type:complete len:644 (-),score=80.81 gnl/Hemi2/5978_TR2075_c0_g5_i1:84-2015(-)
MHSTVMYSHIPRRHSPPHSAHWNAPSGALNPRTPMSAVPADHTQRQQHEHTMAAHHYQGGVLSGPPVPLPYGVPPHSVFPPPPHLAAFTPELSNPAAMPYSQYGARTNGNFSRTPQSQPSLSTTTPATHVCRAVNRSLSRSSSSSSDSDSVEDELPSLADLPTINSSVRLDATNATHSIMIPHLTTHRKQHKKPQQQWQEHQHSLQQQQQLLQEKQQQILQLQQLHSQHEQQKQQLQLQQQQQTAHMQHLRQLAVTQELSQQPAGDLPKPPVVVAPSIAAISITKPPPNAPKLCNMRGLPALESGLEPTDDDIIAYRYIPLAVVGDGVSATAIKCFDMQTTNLVVLKAFDGLENTGAEEKDKKHFLEMALEEAEILKYINSKDPQDAYHIIRMYDYFVFRRVLYVVMEPLGESLYSLWLRCKNAQTRYFTLGKLQCIARQVLISLNFVHNELGFVHGDIKPENVLIKDEAECAVKLIDFGLCQENRSGNLTAMVQTRLYRAPEVFLGVPYDHKIDMWSLGAVLIELFTGHSLFPAKSSQAVLAKMHNLCGPFEDCAPELLNGVHTASYFVKDADGDYFVFEQSAENNNNVTVYPRKNTKLVDKIQCSDPLFTDFVTRLMKLRPSERMDARDALHHPWLEADYS